MKKSFCLLVPMENLAQIFPGFGSGLDLDPLSSNMLDPDPHIIKADQKHWVRKSRYLYHFNTGRLNKTQIDLKPPPLFN
jgi:hypothetical protein